MAYSCWLLIGQDLLLPTGYAALIPHTPEMTITPKKYAVIILPISGAMISITALLAVIEDTVRFSAAPSGLLVMTWYLNRMA